MALRTDTGGYRFIFKIDFEDVIVIWKRMRLRVPVNSLTYIILILYVFIPMLDGMVCADCTGNPPFQGKTTIGHLQAPHDDVIYPSHAGTKSQTSAEQNTRSFCSICANVLMGVEVFLPQVHNPVAPWHAPCAVPILSEFHYSIDKPPQNLLA